MSFQHLVYKLTCNRFFCYMLSHCSTIRNMFKLFKLNLVHLKSIKTQEMWEFNEQQLVSHFPFNWSSTSSLMTANIPHMLPRCCPDQLMLMRLMWVWWRGTRAGLQPEEPSLRSDLIPPINCFVKEKRSWFMCALQFINMSLMIGLLNKIIPICFLLLYHFRVTETGAYNH